MKKTIYIVSDVELGWDCIIGAYTNKEAAEKKKASRNGTGVIHTKTLEDDYINDDDEE